LNVYYFLHNQLKIPAREARECVSFLCDKFNCGDETGRVEIALALQSKFGKGLPKDCKDGD